MFWGEECHRGVTVGGWGVTVGGWGVTVGGWDFTVGNWGVTVGVVVTVVDITVGEIDVTDGVIQWLSQWRGVSSQCWCLVGWVCCTRWADPTTHVTPGKHGPESGPREPGAGGVDPPLAAAALD